MTNRIPDYLKLHIEEHADALPGKLPVEYDRLCSLFSTATGFQLCIEGQVSNSQLTFPWSDPKSVSYRASLETPQQVVKPNPQAQREFEEAFSGLLNKLSQTQYELRRREAELAAAVPVVSVDQDGDHLAERLESVLRGTADMLHCYAAGLYLLDEATTSLKLRAQVGLDPNTLLSPPRRLEAAVADVEALAGHAVVIDDTQALSRWNAPEKSESAICVPVSSATTILGTLWLYRDVKRDFSPTEQNLAEITAGRLAADLDRAVLIQEVRSLRGKKPSKAEGEDGRQADLGKVAPFVEGWQVAESTPGGGVAASFCHWHVADAAKLHLGVGTAHGLASQPTSRVALQAAHAAHTQHDPAVGEVFVRLNESLWTSSMEGAPSSLFHAKLDPTCGSLEYALAGGIFAYVLRPHGWEPLLAGPGVLGTDYEFEVEVHRQALMPGDILVVMSGRNLDRGSEQDNLMNQVAEKLLHNTHLSAADLAETTTAALDKLYGDAEDRLSVLVAKRAE